MVVVVEVCSELSFGSVKCLVVVVVFLGLLVVLSSLSKVSSNHNIDIDQSAYSFKGKGYLL